MDTATMNEVRGVTRKLAGYYGRVWPSLQEDLQQLAWVEAIKAARRWDPSKGTKLTSYVWTAVQCTLWSEGSRMAAPVYAAKHKRRDLVGLYSEPIEAAQRAPYGPPRSPLPEETSTQAHLVGRLEALIHEDPEGYLAAEVLLDERPAQRVARRHDVPRKQVVAATDRVRSRLQQDEMLRALWEAWDG